MAQENKIHKMPTWKYWNLSIKQQARHAMTDCQKVGIKWNQ